MCCVLSCFLAFSIAFSLKTLFSALSHKAPAFIYIVFISFIATDLRPHVLSLSTIHIHLNQLVFHHLSTKRPQARFLSHSLLIYIRTPRNLQRATRSTAHLAGALRILPRLIDAWCFVLFLCRALHSIVTYELINDIYLTILIPTPNVITILWTSAPLTPTPQTSSPSYPIP